MIGCRKLDTSLQIECVSGEAARTQLLLAPKMMENSAWVDHRVQERKFISSCGAENSNKSGILMPQWVA